MKADGTTPGLWRVLALPLLLAAGNYFLWPTLARLGLPGLPATIGFNGLRFVLMAWAGSRAAARGSSGLGQAFAGIAILIVDHVVLKGGTFLIEEALGHSTAELSYAMAFGGVLVSFVMFSPLAGLVGWLGGRWGRRPIEPRPANGAASP